MSMNSNVEEPFTDKADEQLTGKMSSDLTKHLSRIKYSTKPRKPFVLLVASQSSGQ